jgi:hypothetical protein
MVLIAALVADGVLAQDRTQDRGPGLPTSQFGTYVRQGELLVYPSFEYYWDKDFEYDPRDFGFASGGEFKGRYRANEEVLFLAYGLSDRLAWELEGAALQTSLRREAGDRSGMPAELKQSGLGDVQTRLTWRWLAESDRRPEVFSYAEVFFPYERGQRLVGTADWVGGVGLGATRGFRWGTVTARVAGEYDTSSASPIDFSEVAIEYLKRLSPRITFFGALVLLQGDEASLVTEVQWRLSPHVVLRLNNGQGLTPHGPEWAPEVGVLFSFPRR